MEEEKEEYRIYRKVEPNRKVRVFKSTYGDKTFYKIQIKQKSALKKNWLKDWNCLSTIKSLQCLFTIPILQKPISCLTVDFMPKPLHQEVMTEIKIW